LTFLLVFAPFSVAATLQPDLVTEPHGVAYWIQRNVQEPVYSFVNRVRGDKAQAKWNLELMKRRAAELEWLGKRNLTDRMPKIAENLGRRVKKVRKEAEDLPALGEEEMKKLIKKAASKHIEVLEDVEERVPEVAKPSIRKAINVSKRGRKEAVEAVEKIEEAKEKVEKEFRNISREEVEKKVEKRLGNINEEARSSDG